MMVVQNTGHSPAFDVHIWRCGEVRSTEPVVGKESPNKKRCLSNGSGVLGPTAQVNFEIPDLVHTVPADDLATSAFQRDRPHLYVWGKITYRILAQDKQHFTSFCILTAGTSVMAPCEKGNDAD
jgi:hypothetical protein